MSTSHYARIEKILEVETNSITRIVLAAYLDGYQRGCEDTKDAIEVAAKSERATQQTPAERHAAEESAGSPEGGKPSRFYKSNFEPT